VDNVDGFTNATGFPLTPVDQLTYNRFLAMEAHVRGLSIGLAFNSMKKNVSLDAARSPCR
jgi:hypothetical protein